MAVILDEGRSRKLLIIFLFLLYATYVQLCLHTRALTRTQYACRSWHMIMMYCTRDNDDDDGIQNDVNQANDSEHGNYCRLLKIRRWQGS